ncbi:sugar transferase [Sinirhodobacter sp. WL0062]|uniref:Sugar transferase n=1 Tax=Rhodobacter flavimaris TaxID=2907145 RepID=A0ABS8YRV3_9RHOB|nr:sugar transferase [Sinirhodobacter sp. WL0062]MCE5972173.1 sugar transferase [Sinirhodobacter sp. WL0062]
MSDLFLSEISPPRTEVPQRRGLYLTGGKRCFDLTLTLLLLPLCAPLIALCWVLARRDGGPGFFRQPRVGRDGRVFLCIKIRTMAPDAEAALRRLLANDPALAQEWDHYQKLRRDPRVTRLGRLLRATSLDELPQLFNVLRGDMSLVGPRPFLPDQEHDYRAAGGRSYYRLRPGITGPWQLEARGTSSFAARVRFDESYLTDQSLLRDVAMILRTALVPLRANGS